MLVALFMKPFWILIMFLIGLIPSMSVSLPGFNALLNIVGYGNAIIGTGFTLTILSNIVFWLVVQMTWAIIEWLYKKIPGIK